jgi:hypothetical protein
MLHAFEWIFMGFIISLPGMQICGVYDFQASSCPRSIGHRCQNMIKSTAKLKKSYTPQICMPGEEMKIAMNIHRVQARAKPDYEFKGKLICIYGTTKRRNECILSPKVIGSDIAGSRRVSCIDLASERT